VGEERGVAVRDLGGVVVEALTAEIGQFGGGVEEGGLGGHVGGDGWARSGDEEAGYGLGVVLSVVRRVRG